MPNVLWSLPSLDPLNQDLDFIPSINVWSILQIFRSTLVLLEVSITIMTWAAWPCSNLRNVWTWCRSFSLSGQSIPMSFLEDHELTFASDGVMEHEILVCFWSIKNFLTSYRGAQALAIWNTISRPSKGQISTSIVPKSCMAHTLEYGWHGKIHLQWIPQLDVAGTPTVRILLEILIPMNVWRITRLSNILSFLD